MKCADCPYEGSPTVVPENPFNPHCDAELLRKAMKGFGTDEKTIINILTKRINIQRLDIAATFETLYGKNLMQDLKSELSGNFKSLVTALMTPIYKFYANELHDAMCGLGTNEDVLIEIMCTLSNRDINIIKETYSELYNCSLGSDLTSDTSGYFRRLMMSLFAAERDESKHTNSVVARNEAKILFEAGENRWGTDETAFNRILCYNNKQQLRLIFDEYHKLTGHDIEIAIEKEFSGDTKKVLLAVVHCVKNQVAFFAKRLNESMKGAETNNRDLQRVIVTRCELDMNDIKMEYLEKYGNTLAYAITSHCSGDYKNCLLALIGEG